MMYFLINMEILYKSDTKKSEKTNILLTGAVSRRKKIQKCSIFHYKNIKYHENIEST
jgi:hypothetical protein